MARYSWRFGESNNGEVQLEVQGELKWRGIAGGLGRAEIVR